MYRYLDRCLSDLDAGSRLLVWSMRQWVLAMGEQQCPSARLAPAFCQARLIPALMPFLRLMATLNRYGLENFGFSPATCQRASEHEALILSMVRIVGNSAAEHLGGVLELLVADEGHGAMHEALGRIHAVFDQAGLIAVDE